MSRKTNANWTESQSGFERIDTEAGIIYGVRIVGQDSRNGRTYLESTLRNAVELYEGTRVFIDHNRPDPKTGVLVERSIRDKWGELRNVRFQEGGLVGDLHYLKTHAMTPMLVESAQRFPATFGLSHDAGGDEVVNKGRVEVVDIKQVKSVDVVNCPATTNGLFESKENKVKKTFKEIAKTHAKQKFAHILEGMMSMDEGMGDTMVEMDDAMAEDPEMQVASAFRAAMIAVLDDESIDMAAKLAKLKTIMGAKTAASDAISGGEKTEESDDYEMEESDKTSGKSNLLEEVKTLKAKLADKDLVEECTNLLVSKKREVTAVRLSALKSVAKNDRVALVESWEPQKGKDRLQASPGLYAESVDASGALYPKSTEEFAKRLR